MRNTRISRPTGDAAVIVNPSLRPTICLLALSRIADDPRVRRQGDAFCRAGWRVIGVGLPGARSPGPAWPIVTTSRGASPITTTRRSSLIERLCGDGARLRLLKRVCYALCLLAVRVRPHLAQRLYWAANPSIGLLAENAREIRADVWLANDWNTLPLAARLADVNGGAYGYDTHEYAVEEYGEKLSWRLWHRPMVRALEAKFVGRAVAVSAVSGGIAAELNRLYALPRRCLVVRNTPDLRQPSFRATGAAVRVLYHGLLAPGRGLEVAIASVAHWRTEFDLTIRGPGSAVYLAALQHRIDALNLGDRVRLLPAVPTTELIEAAAAFDIGFFALPGTSHHNRFALPNKIFEYIMAGLALCVSNLPEMAQLVADHRVGVTFEKVEPAAIAAAINGLDRLAIDRYKRASLAAARVLCWERESEKLITAYGMVRGCATPSIPTSAVP